MTRRKVKLIFYAVLSLALMGFIYCLSSQPAPRSQNLSDGLLYEILKFFGVEDGSGMERYGRLIRKVTHFLEYSALGISTGLFFTTLLGDVYAQLLRAGLWAGSISGLYAVSDELHQHFVPGRSMQLSDVLLDCAGAATAILFLYFLKRNIYSHREERKNFE